MFRLEEEKNSRGTVMSGSAIRGRQGSERFFTLPAVTLIASSFVLGMSEFVVVGILSDIAHGLRVSEVTVGNLVSLFATHLTLPACSSLATSCARSRRITRCCRITDTWRRSVLCRSSACGPAMAVSVPCVCEPSPVDDREVPVAVAGAGVSFPGSSGERGLVRLVGRVDVQQCGRLVADDHVGAAAARVRMEPDEVELANMVTV